MAANKSAAPVAAAPSKKSGRDLFFAAGIVSILAIFFLPIPAFLIDMGLAFSIALSVLILMVALWIEKPLDFSAPSGPCFSSRRCCGSRSTLRRTRLILSNGPEGVNAAGFIIGGFSKLVMSGDFVIGLIVFAILITVNFLVITKGATRIAEGRGALHARCHPRQANGHRCRSKCRPHQRQGGPDPPPANSRKRAPSSAPWTVPRNSCAVMRLRASSFSPSIFFGGIIIGSTRHGMPLAPCRRCLRQALGRRWSGLTNSSSHRVAGGRIACRQGRDPGFDRKGGSQSARELSTRPVCCRPIARASVAGAGPSVSAFRASRAASWPLSAIRFRASLPPFARQKRPRLLRPRKMPRSRFASRLRESLKTVEVELVMGKQLALKMLAGYGELGARVAKMRRKFARQYGIVVPEIKLSDSLMLPPKA